MQKKILVTGGAGFIGQQTVPLLIERGYDVHLAVRKQTCFSYPVTTHQVDLLDCHQHLPLIRAIRPTHLLHAAWYTENGKFWDAIDNIGWLKASISLAEIFYEEGGQRLLGLGSCAEYDWNEISDGCFLEGKTAENPASLYGKIKKSTYECLKALAQFYSREFVWARIFFPYGPAESKKRLIPYVITNLLQGKLANCTHGNQMRDFLHVNDIGHALVAVLDSSMTGAVNIGSGSAVTIRDVILQIAKILDREELIRLGAMAEPAYSPPKILANVDRLKKEIDWMPQLSLEQGLLNTIYWWQKSLQAS